MPRHGNHRHLRHVLLDLARGGEAAHFRHRQIKDGDVRLQRADAIDRDAAIRRLADHLDVGPVGEQRAQALAHCFVVLGDEHADLLHDPAAGPSAWLATGASR